MTSILSILSFLSIRTRLSNDQYSQYQSNATYPMSRPTPHLVLSIIGGAKNFRLDGRKKEVFKRGLIGETTTFDMRNNNV